MNWVLNLFVVWALYSVNGLLDQFRLAGDIVPKHYDLTLMFDIDPKTNFSFFGAVVILITANKSTAKIVLHAQDITIFESKINLISVSSQIRRENQKTIDVAKTQLDPEKQLLTINFKTKLTRNQLYHLSIPFYGRLKMHEATGVYINHYVNKETMAEEYSVTTMFQPIYARTGFPCFDEPQYKATFMVTIGHHKDYNALSNMPLIENSGDNALDDFFSWEVIEETFLKSKLDFVFDHFENSKPMSTYLVAFSVSKYVEAVSPSRHSAIKIGVWARRDVIDQTSYAAAVAPDILSYYEQFFKMTYHLPKIDHIFERVVGVTGRENWGLINYPERMLFNGDKCTQMGKINLMSLMSHEVCHQWFGNLVTMSWWDDLWLQEGFATFMATLSLYSLGSEDVNNFDGFVTLSELVLTADALQSSLPISRTTEVKNPTRITEAFNNLSFKKAAVLIRMLFLTLGEDVFKDACHSYLLEHSFQSTVPDDLWSEMNKACLYRGILIRNVTVKRVMETWTTKPGYPLLTVERDYDSRLLTITQKRYLSGNQSAPQSTGWWIPLTVMAQGDDQRTPPPVHWLADDEGTIAPHQFQHKASSDEWLVFNIDMTALCRVNYDSRNWQLLSETLRSTEYKSIPKFSRAQLTTDAFELAKNGNLDYAVPLELVKFLSREEEYEVLLKGFSQLSSISALLKRTSEHETFQKYVQTIIKEPYKKFGGLDRTNSHGKEVELQRQLITSWACDMNVPGCQKAALGLFEKWMDTKDPDKNNPIPISLRETVYCLGVARGGVEHWDFMMARANKALTGDHINAMSALACSREPWLLRRTLELTASGQFGIEAASVVIATAMRNPVGYSIVKNLLYKKSDDFFSRLAALFTTKVLADVTYLVEQFIDQEELDEFLTWREDNAKDLKSLQADLDLAVAQASVNIAWLAKYRHLILDKMRELYQYEEDSINSSKQISIRTRDNVIELRRKATRTSKASKSVYVHTHTLNVICYTYLIGRTTL